MDIFQSAAASWLIFILGIISVVSILLILLSCRCIPYSRLEINQRTDEIRDIQAFFQVSLLHLVGFLAVSSCTRNFRHRGFWYTLITILDAGIKEQPDDI